MRTNTFTNLQRQCQIKGVVCERSRGKIEMTTPDGGTTAECLTVAEAMETLHHDSTFASLPIKLAKTGWQRQVEAEAKAALQITPLDHLRAIATGLRDCDKGNGDRLIAANILKHVHALEAERAELVALRAVAKAAHNLSLSQRGSRLILGCAQIPAEEVSAVREALSELERVRVRNEVAK